MSRSDFFVKTDPDFYTAEYIGAVGIDNVLPPAAVEVPNTYKQAMASPQTTQWQKAMRKELDSLNDHEVADLILFSSVPAGYSIIGARWLFRVKMKTDGSNCSRNIAVRYHALRSWINEDRIPLDHVSPSAMLSDI